MLIIGDLVKGYLEESSASYVVVSIHEENINGIEYTVYNLLGDHILYVNKTKTLNSNDCLNLEGRVIVFPEDKIKMKVDYFILVNLNSVLPV